MKGEIADVREQITACSARARALTEGMSAVQLGQRPAPGGWSVAECIAHLTLTTRNYLPPVYKALEIAPQGSGPYKMDFTGRMLRWVLEPPYRMKTKTLPSFEPGAEKDSGAALPEFLHSQDDLLKCLASCEGRALDKVKIQSSFNERMHYNVYSCFEIMTAHQRRHLWQAENVKKKLVAT